VTESLEAIDRLWARGIKVPVATLEDFDRLDDDEIVAGYRAYRRDDPEPGNNHSRAFWFGWCNRARDCGSLPSGESSRQLVHLLHERGDFKRVRRTSACAERLK
jgi:hypothetical protein